MDAPESITVNSKYHAELLSTIAGLEYVPQAKKDQIEYVKDLDQQIESGKVRILELAAKTKKERKEHEAFRDSVAKRFAHLLIGKKEKFAQKASKEEREYVEALEHEMTERDTQNTRLKMHEEGSRVLEDLKAKEAVYESTKTELHALYGAIFDGPTEAFPEDDQLEYAVIEATKRHEQAQARVNAESRAAELLAKATQAMSSSHQSARDALMHSTFDVWGGGGMSDMLERNALRSAEVYAGQAGMLIDQAQRISPDIRPIPRVQIAQGAFLGDIFFDNIFTDMAFHEKIKASVAQLVIASERLKVERDAARNRTEAAGAEVLIAAEDLQTRRQELDNFRRTTFESYVAQHPPPPNYDGPVFPVPAADGPSTAGGSPTAAEDEIDQFFLNLATTPAVAMQSTHLQMPTPQTAIQVPSITWGSRNPFAFALSEETRKLSE